MGAELGSLGRLRVLSLDGNLLSGTLPASWGEQMSALYQLSLDENNFQASPALWQALCSELKFWRTPPSGS